MQKKTYIRRKIVNHTTHAIEVASNKPMARAYGETFIWLESKPYNLGKSNWYSNL